MYSIIWKAINTLLKALERYAILTTGKQDQRKRGQPVNPWIKEKGEKYLRGWDRRATIVLLGASLLLTLYRFIGAQKGLYPVFWEVLHPPSTQENFSVFLLVLDDYGHATTVAGPFGKIWYKRQSPAITAFT